MFDDARAIVHGLRLWLPRHALIWRIGAKNRWGEWCGRNEQLLTLLQIPEEPHRAYRNTGWISYDDWMGPRPEPKNKGAETQSEATDPSENPSENDHVLAKAETRVGHCLHCPREFTKVHEEDYPQAVKSLTRRGKRTTVYCVTCTSNPKGWKYKGCGDTMWICDKVECRNHHNKVMFGATFTGIGKLRRDPANVDFK